MHYTNRTEISLGNQVKRSYVEELFTNDTYFIFFQRFNYKDYSFLKRDKKPSPGIFKRWSASKIPNFNSDFRFLNETKINGF